MLMQAYGRNGMYSGKIYQFTHRNPETGEVWSDDIPVKSGNFTEYGTWVKADNVKWC